MIYSREQEVVFPQLSLTLKVTIKVPGPNLGEVKPAIPLLTFPVIISPAQFSFGVNTQSTGAVISLPQS